MRPELFMTPFIWLTEMVENLHVFSDMSQGWFYGRRLWVGV